MYPERLPEAEGVESSSAPASQHAATAFVVLRDWAAMRNYLRPDMLDVMARSGHQFVILTEGPPSPAIRACFHHTCFVFETLDKAGLEKIRKTRLYDFLRMVRYFTYGGAPWEAMGTRKWQIRVQVGALRSRTNWVGRRFFDFVECAARFASAFRAVRRLLLIVESRLFAAASHGELYTRYKPNLLIVSTHGYSTDPLLANEAKRHGVRVLSIVKSWDNPTSRGYGGLRADHMFVWTNIMREQMIRHHDVPPERIEVVGIPAWDNYFTPSPAVGRTSLLSRYRLDPAKAVIYQALSGPREGASNLAIAKMLLAAIRDGRIARPAQLLIRVHPAFRLAPDRARTTAFEAELASLQHEYGSLCAISDQETEVSSGVLFLKPENQDRIKEILLHADVMVTSFSTQVIEAALFDLPTVNVAFQSYRGSEYSSQVLEDFDHIRRVIESNALDVVYNEEQMIAAVNAALMQRSRRAAARKRLAEQECDTNRGRAGAIVAKRICALTAGKG